MSKVILIHGPNLNLLGSREPEKYGSISSEAIVERLNALGVVNYIDYFQSNNESELIDVIHSAKSDNDGILINAGAFSHSSIAIADAIRSIGIPAISIHITNIYAREGYRHQDVVGDACSGSIVGLGIDGYALALEHLSDLIQDSRTS